MNGDSPNLLHFQKGREGGIATTSPLRCCAAKEEKTKKGKGVSERIRYPSTRYGRSGREGEKRRESEQQRLSLLGGGAEQGKEKGKRTVALRSFLLPGHRRRKEKRLFSISSIDFVEEKGGKKGKPQYLIGNKAIRGERWIISFIPIAQGGEEEGRKSAEDSLRRPTRKEGEGA